MAWTTTGYPTSAQIADRLRERSATYGTVLCEVADLGEPTGGGVQMNYVRVGGGPSPVAKVLLIGGIHAREWEPPLALTNLISLLLDAYLGNTPATMGTTSRSPEDVHAIVQHVAIYIAPLINADGYDFSRGRDTAAMFPDRRDGWRKNRRAAPSTLPSGCTAANALGVDINRNFNIVWDITTGYAPGSNVSASLNPCNELYIGPPIASGGGPESEPETRNVKALLDLINPEFYVDVHMGTNPAILFPWAIEQNTTVPGPTPVPPASAARDGTVAISGVATYAEAINADDARRHLDVGTLMSDAALAATGTTYTPHQAALLYPASGTSSDFAYARNLGTARSTLSYTIESGRTFLPDFATEHAGLQAEIQAALLALARYAAPAASSPPPSPSPAAPASSCRCA